MDDLALARVIHVVAVVLWIGGVAFVTTVVFPTIRRDRAPAERLGFFHRFENGFSWQARIWVFLAGASGLWITWRADLWWRFAELRFWWMTGMVAIWTLFAVMLFILEPLFIHRRFQNSQDPVADFRRFERMHRILLAASLIVTAGAVGGAHGLW
jgi:uncharacterized membrane protein